MISIGDLTYQYPVTWSGRNITALSHVNLQIREGESVHLAGPSGSGKSTLLRCLNGLIPHSSPGSMEGNVVVAGMDTREHEVCEFAPFVGLVFQDPDYQLFSSDVLTELSFGPEQLGWREDRIDGAVRNALEWLDITRLVDRQIDDLSWGERQRVAIASVVATTPLILALDEPFSGIDSSAAESLARCLETLNRSTGITIIVAEHRNERVAGWVKRTVMLERGSVVYDGQAGGAPVSHYPRDTGMRDEPLLSAGFKGAQSGNNMTRGEPTVMLQGITYRFPGCSRPAIDSIDLEIFPGEITVVTGPNGSGKSTLLRHLNGLLRPGKGSVRLLGCDIGNRTVADNARVAGLLTQHADHHLFAETISEELAFAPGNFGVSRAEQEERIEHVMEDLSITHLGKDTPPLGISAGEKQRVAIGSLLVMNTPVIVMDEPTIGLDITLKTALAMLLEGLKNQGKTIIVATHDQEFANLIADRVIRIENGRVIGNLSFHNVEKDGRRATE